MIDFHNHILPNIDDGSRSLEMSLSMLDFASKQGITDVVNTVHYQHPKVETKLINYNFIKIEIKKLQVELDKARIPLKIHIGSEVYFLPNLLKLTTDLLATFGNGKYMLIEFPVYQLPKIQRKILFDLKMAGVTPIIAHPERYKDVQDNIDIVTNWLESGCVIQVDAGSILGQLGSGAKKISEQIVKNGWCHIIGSDSHDNKKRNFNLLEAVNTVHNWIGNEVNTMVNENPKAVIEGKPIKIDIDYVPKSSNSRLIRLLNRLRN